MTLLKTKQTEENVHGCPSSPVVKTQLQMQRVWEFNPDSGVRIPCPCGKSKHKTKPYFDSSK